MKKNRLIYVFATLILGVALIFSCQKEEVSNPEQGLMLKSGSVDDCSQCVANWMDSKVTQGDWVKFENSKNNPEVVAPYTYLDTYNDGANVYYQVYRTSGTFDEIRINGGDGIIQLGMTTYSWQESITEGLEACKKVTVTVELRGVSGGTGKTVPKSFDYYLRELCACDESFTYVLNEDKSYTFTYTPAEDLADQLVTFTFAQGTVVKGLDETWSTNGVTRQKTMSFTKCEPVSWTVKLEADCNGHSGQSNVWTDFKLWEVSKKGDLPKIIQICE